jgi:hypothetical protein
MDMFELWKLYKNGVEKEIEGWFYDHDLITFWLIDFIQKEAGCAGIFANWVSTWESRPLPWARWRGRMSASSASTSSMKLLNT